MIKKSFLTALIVSMVSIAISTPAIGDDTINFPESGEDCSDLRCRGDVVSIGATADEVAGKCGDPAARGHVPNINLTTYDVWVYPSDDGNEVNYLGFRDRRLERIYSVNCVTRDPYCP